MLPKNPRISLKAGILIKHVCLSLTAHCLPKKITVNEAWRSMIKNQN